MVRLSFSLLLVTALGACAVGIQPQSANPYEPQRVSPGATGGAGATAAVAAATGVQRRIEGECYVSCLKGTACNEETGLCDPLPCRGECKDNERCDESGLIPKCVPEPEFDLKIEEAVKP